MSILPDVLVGPGSVALCTAEVVSWVREASDILVENESVATSYI